MPSWCSALPGNNCTPSTQTPAFPPCNPSVADGNLCRSSEQRFDKTLETGLSEMSMQEATVISGDLVRSSDLSMDEIKEVRAQLYEGIEAFDQVFPNCIFGKLDIYSGDGWQVLLTQWRYSFRFTLYLRAKVRGMETPKTDTRAALAFGHVDLASVNPDRISESTGDAFTASGHALNGMDKHRRLALETVTPFPAATYLIPTMALLDEIVSTWTKAQSRTIALALLGFNQQGIADQYGKSQPTIQKSLISAGWRGLEEFLLTIENSPLRL
jgi:hypothetical protein